MGKKYQIFISSTYEDLREERDKVRDAILSMYHFPVGMELFGAASEEQWEIIKETIDTSDYYVLIVGQRYGTVIPDGPDKGISYTEKEFRYAKEKGIPILAFLIDDSVPVKAAYVEKKHIKEFDKFTDVVKNGRTVTWWKNADDLALKVTTALHKQIERTPRQGWVRVDGAQINQNESTNQSHSTKETSEAIGKLVSALPPKHEEFYYQEEIEKIVYNTMKKALDIINTAKFEEFSMYITMNKLKEVMGSIRPYCNVCKEAKYATYLYNMCRSTLIFCQVAADDKDLLKKREQALHEDLLILRGFIKCMVSD